MPILMLDANTASYAIKHRFQIGERLAQYDPEDICLSAIAEAELLSGLRKLPADHSLHQRVPVFMERFRRIPWDSDAATVHAVIRYRLLSAGQPIGEMDTMIAAHAMNITLVTNNTKHVERLSPPLRLENWVGEEAGR
ncbi:MAG: type II toxin-antitoxin system VapC family toxin [Thermomicrobiales bacterium]